MSDPLVRYQLITLGTYYGIQKAYIKDRLVGKSSLIRVGEMIGDCKLIEIQAAEKAVRLKPAKGPEFTVTK
jgi:hypothetical protein